MIEGSCLCRGIAWAVDGPLEIMSHCHCSMCRKAHGSAFATYVMCRESHFRWLSGRELRSSHASSPGNTRSFCSVCGSVVPGDAHAGRIAMPAGNLDGDPEVRPLVHIFTTSKAPWYSIADALPQFDAFPPGIDAPSVELPRPTAPSRPGALCGSCLCGDVVYEVSGDLEGVIQCHCSRCRKARSAAHGTNLFVANPRLEWLSGREQVKRYALPEATAFGNSFCTRCGSLVPRPDPAPGRLLVPAGGLDTSGGVVVKLHIFTGSKAPWYEIVDTLPQIPDRPGAR